MALIPIDELSRMVSDAGHEFTVAMNPILEAVQKKIEENKKINALASVPPLTPEEEFAKVIKTFTGCKVPANLGSEIAKKPRRIMAGPVAPLPAKYDSRDLGIVPPIRNQASCGSCWCFAAVGAAEIYACKLGLADAKTIDLSEQEILNCGPNGGCDGDWPSTAFDHMKNKGTTTEASVPYRSTSGNGRCSVNPPFRVSGYDYCGTTDGIPSIESIKAKIMERGSAAVAVAVDNAWAAYSGGVFNGSAQGINHAIIAIGWDDANGSWTVRNHWGVQWGESGYIRTKWGANLIGYGAMGPLIDAPAPAPLPPAPPVPVPPVPPSPPIPPTPIKLPLTASVAIKGMFGTINYPVQGYAIYDPSAKASSPKYVQSHIFSWTSPGGVQDCGCDDKPLSLSATFSFSDYLKLIPLVQDVFALLQSGEVSTVKGAIGKIIADGKAGEWAKEFSDVVALTAAMEKLAPLIEALWNKYHWTREARMTGLHWNGMRLNGEAICSDGLTWKWGDGSIANWLIANGPSILDLIGKILVVVH